MTALADHLSKSPYFEGLSAEQITKVCNLATEKVFPRDNELIKESSDNGDLVFLLLEGRVDVTVSLVGATSNTEKIATLGPGQVVGEMILLGKHRRSANVIARDDVKAAVWSAGDLNNLFKDDQNLGFNVMRNMASHMAERLVAANQVLRNSLSLQNNPLL